MNSNMLRMSMFDTSEGVGQHIDIMGEITTRFANLCAEKMDAGIRAKLVELGWTPPNTEKIDWTKDAEEWGDALNSAGWEFLEKCPEKSALVFNHCKSALRAAILKYAEEVRKAGAK